MKKAFLLFTLVFAIVFSSPILVSCADNNPAPQRVALEDDEECKDKLCDCGNVQIDKGCTCELTGPTGIGTNCPPKPVNIGLITGAIVAVGLVIFFIRRKKNS